jgi:hypothetical protein
LLAQLRVMTPALLPADAVLEFEFTAKIGGGHRCRIPDCVRIVQSTNLCSSHFGRWRGNGRPDLETWDPGSPAGRDRINLSSLPEQLRWEIAYGLRCAEASADLQMSFHGLEGWVRHIANTGFTYLLEVDEARWPSQRGNVT